MRIDASILVVGVGGLGVPAALALARAGLRCPGLIGLIGLVDPDPVELSNLHRQVIYGGDDIGRPKVEAAARHLREIEPALAVETMGFALDAGNACEIIERFDFVIDGTDSPSAKFLINDTCVAAGRAFVYGGVLAMSGQMMTVIPGRTACLRCLFEEPPGPAEAASCREAGILGPIAGAIGELQVREAIEVLSGRPPRVSGAVLTYDGAGAPRVRVARVNPRPGCACGAYRHGTCAPAQLERMR